MKPFTRLGTKYNYFSDLIILFLLSRKRRFEHDEVLLIMGDPRGGTTWLAELLQNITNTSLLWEPLWIDREATFRNLGFSHRQYIPVDIENARIKEAFTNLFEGRILNPFLCQMTNPKELKSASQLIIKFCRANQLLPWLTENFHFKFDPIYLIRHPCAVVASQLKQGGWDHVPPHFDIPENTLYPEFYTKHHAFLMQIDSKVKRLAAIWCLCNQIPLNSENNNKRWVTITYENLYENGESELKKIENRWGIKLPDKCYEKLSTPSKTTVLSSDMYKREVSQLFSWSKNLTAKQIDEIMYVLDYFDIKLYDRDYFPKSIFE